MRTISCFVLSLAIAGLAVTSQAQSASLEGLWSGSGTVRYQGGSERVSCRVTYSPSSGRTWEFSANCATASISFQQRGRLIKVGASRYSGSVYNDQYSVAGKISVSVSGSRQSVRVSNPQGSASLTLRKR